MRFMWFTPPTFPDDPEKSRFAASLFYTAWTVLGAQVLAVAVPLYPGPALRQWGLGGLLAAMSAAAIWCARRGRLSLGSHFLIVGIWGGTAASALAGGDITSGYSGFAVAVLVAGLLCGARVSAAYLAASIAIGFVVFSRFPEGFAPPGAIYAGASHAFVLRSLILAGVWAIAAIGATSIRTALARTREELEERKRSDAARRASEERFRLLAGATFEGIGISQAGRLVDVNLQLARMLGFDREGELVGRRVEDFVAPEDLDRVIAHMRGGSAEAVEFLARRRDGTVLPVEVRVRTLPADGQQPARVAIVRDISERRRMDALLLRIAHGVGAETGELFLRSLVRHLAEGLGVDTCFVGELLAGGQRARTVALYRDGAIVENVEYQVVGSPCEPDRCRDQRVCLYPERVRETFPLDRQLADWAVEAYAGHLLVSSGGQPLGLLVVMHRRPFHAPPWIESALRIFAIRAAAELERIRADRQRSLLEEQLRQAQKLETIGQLAGGIAHDFNNLLTPVLGYADLLLEQSLPDDPRSRQIAFIREAAEKATSLTRQLLSFSRRQVLTMRPLDLNRVVEGFSKILRRTIRENIQIEIVTEAPDAAIVGDETQIEQVVMNLALNAQDAMPAGGLLRIHTRIAAPGDVSDADGLAVACPSVVLTVSDTGVGMDDTTKAHLFEPFFTTKEKGHGTGLGLSTVYGIVQQHRGSVTVASRPGEGTTVRICLPLAAAEEAVAAAAPARRGAGGETIAVVEDDPAVRRLTCAILRQRGYNVLEFDGPAACLKATAEAYRCADLLLTDIVMPGMNGRQLYDRLVACHPGLRVLFMSGYAADVVAAHGVAKQEIALLSKPFSPDALARKVRAVLDAPAPG